MFKGLEAGVWTVTITDGSETASQVVDITTDYSIAITFNAIPAFTYDGEYEIVDDDDNPIDTSNRNWKIRFLTSGTLRFINFHGWTGLVDIFLVGGGGSSTTQFRSYPGAAGGGYTNTIKKVSLSINTDYSVVIGSGAAPGEARIGGESSFAGYKAGGGQGTNDDNILGYGGSQGGGYSDGNGNSGQRNKPGPNGESGTTREFGEVSGKLYAGGGGSNSNPTGGEGGGGNKNNPGKENTGGGAGGQNTQGNSIGFHGGSGIVIIRNAREVA